MNYFNLLCLLAFSTASLSAASPKKKTNAEESVACQKCHLGVVGFSAQSPDTWYQMSVPTHPETVPLSLNADRGSKQGKIKLTPEGLKILEPGNYSVTFTAILLNNDPNATAIIPVYLVRNGVYDPQDLLTLGNIVALQPGLLGTVQITGILEDIKEETTLSLRASNGASSEPQEISVIAWDISAFKIPCEPSKQS